MIISLLNDFQVGINLDRLLGGFYVRGLLQLDPITHVCTTVRVFPVDDFLADSLHAIADFRVRDSLVAPQTDGLGVLR